MLFSLSTIFNTPALSHVSILENGDNEEDFIFSLLFKLFYTLCMKPFLLILDLFTTQILPILTGKKLFHLFYSLFQSSGLFQFFFALFALLLPVVISLVAFFSFFQNRSYKLKTLILGIVKGTLFIILVPSLFFGIYEVIYLFSSLFFSDMKNYSLANIIYRLGYNHKTDKTYEDIPPGGFTNYKWFIVIPVLYSSYYLIFRLFFPLITIILELFFLFCLSPYIAFSFFHDERKFLTWKKDVFSRFTYSFIVQLIWLIFLIIFLKLTSNPFNLDLFTSHILITIFVLTISKNITSFIKLILSQLNLSLSHSSIINKKSKINIQKFTNFLRKRRRHSKN